MSGQAFVEASRLGLPAELLDPLMRWRAVHPLLLGDRVSWSQRAAELSKGGPPSRAHGTITAIVEGRNGLGLSYLVAFDEPVTSKGWQRATGEPVGRRSAIDAELLELVPTSPTSEPCYPAPVPTIEELCDELGKLGVPLAVLAPIRSWRARPALQVGDRVRWSRACLDRQAAGVTAFEQGVIEELLDPKQGEAFIFCRVRWDTASGKRFVSYHPAELLQVIEHDNRTQLGLQSA